MIVGALSGELYGQSFEWGGGWDSKGLANRIESSASLSLPEKIIRYYQKNVSPLQGPRCPCYPSCSAYVLDAIEKYGFLQGSLMGLSRLYFREHQFMKPNYFYHTILDDDGKIKVYDPVEANNILDHSDWRVLVPDVGANSFKFVNRLYRRSLTPPIFVPPIARTD